MKVTTPVTLPMTGTLLSPAQLTQMTQAAEQEFPYDPVFQQIHLARQILRLEAEQMGIGYFSYITQMANQLLTAQGQQHRLKPA